MRRDESKAAGRRIERSRGKGHGVFPDALVLYTLAYIRPADSVRF